MFLLRLEPPIELDILAGVVRDPVPGDYGHDSQDMWTVILGDGSFWTFPNPVVRATPNVSWGREKSEVISSQISSEAS